MEEIKLGEKGTHYVLCFHIGSKTPPIGYDGLEYISAIYSNINKRYNGEEIPNFGTNGIPPSLPKIELLFFEKGSWRKTASTTINLERGCQDLVGFVTEDLAHKNIRLINE